eukprot:TRINITY_DN8928_c0_g1_i1.p2 TRINITY_DN8928_c0_g1~~TRINITY_DN8928_c0_g1_i1.p2  ORF type:complete len:102 (-),score=14.65 TRINITY_DN8928_c0_g1_i1:247-552(-)
MATVVPFRTAPCVNRPPFDFLFWPPSVPSQSHPAMYDQLRKEVERRSRLLLDITSLESPQQMLQHVAAILRQKRAKVNEDPSDAAALCSLRATPIDMHMIS